MVHHEGSPRVEIDRIIEGNRKFASRNKSLLKELFEKGQKPFAAVVSCSDSRVPVEVIFNELEPGSLFVIRIAGNVVSDSSVKGSIEYAVHHLKIPLLIVLGHTGCGEVKAYLDGVNEGEVGKLLRHMRLESDNLGDAIIENINLQVNEVLRIKAVREAIESKTLRVYGMLYDLRKGLVSILSKNGRPV